jgi:hypothetical protein
MIEICEQYWHIIIIPYKKYFSFRKKEFLFSMICQNEFIWVKISLITCTRIYSECHILFAIHLISLKTCLLRVSIIV